MVGLSKKNRSIIHASQNGYHVTKEGVVVSPNDVKLKLKDNGKGYHTFSFRYFGEVVQISAHRLQAYQKYGNKVFEKGIVCRHLNSNSKDNSHDNIAIGTQSENMMDMPKERRILNASNPKHDHLQIIKDYYENGLKYQALMQKYGINSKGTISNIINKSLALETYRQIINK
jgi:hypothetical protein